MVVCLCMVVVGWWCVWVVVGWSWWLVCGEGALSKLLGARHSYSRVVHAGSGQCDLGMLLRLQRRLYNQ